MKSQSGSSQVAESGKGWGAFPGGELEGKRPKALCPACRERLNRWARDEGGNPPTTLCFQCYRADLDRDRALKAAGELDTASDARFQCTLPFEPVNRPRLERLKVERQQARAAMQIGTAAFVDKRRRAQIAARHALQRVVTRVEGVTGRWNPELAAAFHAAELQLPETWLPYVVSW